MLNSKFYTVMIVLSFAAMAATVVFQGLEMFEYGFFGK